MFAGVGERTREGNDLYMEMIESGVIKLGDKQVTEICDSFVLCSPSISLSVSHINLCTSNCNDFIFLFFCYISLRANVLLYMVK